MAGKEEQRIRREREKKKTWPYNERREWQTAEAVVRLEVAVGRRGRRRYLERTRSTLGKPRWLGEGREAGPVTPGGPWGIREHHI